MIDIMIIVGCVLAIFGGLVVIKRGVRLIVGITNRLFDLIENRIGI